LENGRLLGHEKESLYLNKKIIKSENWGPMVWQPTKKIFTVKVMPENEKPVLIAHPSCKSFEFIQIKQTILDRRKGRPLYWLSHKKNPIFIHS
jgi:hypothetical protein